MEQSINYSQPRCRVGLMISHDAECEQGGMRAYERKENLQSAGRLSDHNCTAAELRRRQPAGKDRYRYEFTLVV